MSATNNSVTNSVTSDSVIKVNETVDIVADIVAAANGTKSKTEDKLGDKDKLGEKDLKKKTIVELKEYCKTHKVSISGKTKKDDIIQAIIASMSNTITKEEPKYEVVEQSVEKSVDEPKNEVVPEHAAPKTEVVPEPAAPKPEVVPEPAVPKSEVEAKPVEKPYNKMNMVELKKLCKERGLKTNAKMKKDDIVHLLESESSKESEQVPVKETKPVKGPKEPVKEPVKEPAKDYNKMTVVQLKELCKQKFYSINPKMKKADLIAMLCPKNATPVLSDSEPEDNASVSTLSTSSTHTKDTTNNKPNYNKMTVVDLKNLCKERNLKLSPKMKKEDIIQLLKSKDTEPVEEPEPVKESVKEPEPIEELVNETEPAKEPVKEPVKESVESVKESVDEEEYVETVQLIHGGVKYWMDIQDNATGNHNVYDYTTLDHIGFFDKKTDVLSKIDE